MKDLLPPHTLVYTEVDSGALKVRRWEVRVLAGPDEGSKKRVERGSLLVGASSSNDLVLSDSRVSRAHLELRVLEKGLHIRDLGSRNGVYLGRVKVPECTVSESAVLRLGDTELLVEPVEETLEIDDRQDHLGNMVGGSAAMRHVFGLIKQVGPVDVGVLIEGETGTGKELVAQEIHRLSNRKGTAPIVIDCGALPEGLVESELFGHVRGSFTGAVSDRDGAFKLADQGTLFLDEIGELPPEMQPKLLRVLETSRFRPVGGRTEEQVNVRIVAATSRDLADEVSKGRFRPDLFYRLAVVRLRMPPLRERLGDMPALIQRLAGGIFPEPLTIPEATMNQLQSHHWPGNVRELRNVLRQALALRRDGILSLPEGWSSQGSVMQASDISGEHVSPSGDHAPPPLFDDITGDYREAKRTAIDRFETGYLQNLLERHAWNVSAAAREAGVDRNYLHRLMKRHGIKRP
jgi:transcriptional regulator with GAF, ATPase, and Fis domain